MLRVAPALVLAVVSLAPAGQTPTVRDIDGRTQQPLAAAAGETHLLFFVAVDCPISNRYAPEIARIITEYAAKRVRPFLVYADPSATPARVRAHRREYHLDLGDAPAIIDTTFAMTTAAGVTVTPEAAVYTRAGRVYRGRIDDWYVSLGQARRAATRKDLRLSLDAVLTGQTIPAPETKAIGCYIEKREQ